MRLVLSMILFATASIGQMCTLPVDTANRTNIASYVSFEDGFVAIGAGSCFVDRVYIDLSNYLTANGSYTNVSQNGKVGKCWNNRLYNSSDWAGWGTGFQHPSNFTYSMWIRSSNQGFTNGYFVTKQMKVGGNGLKVAPGDKSRPA